MINIDDKTVSRFVPIHTKPLQKLDTQENRS